MPANYGVEARLAYLTWLANEDTAEAEHVDLLRDYYSGAHPVRLTDRQREFLGLKSPTQVKRNKRNVADWKLKPTEVYDEDLFAHNLCKLVVEAAVERLKIKGFIPLDHSGPKPDAEKPTSPLAKLAAQWWDLNHMKSKQDEVYEKSLRDGETYLIVDWDTESKAPRWTMNLKFDGTQGIKLHRDPTTDEPIFASKRWLEFDPMVPGKTGTPRMTLYFPDRVEKYKIASGDKGIRGEINGQQLQTGWEPTTDNPGEPWPIPWVDADEKPLGIAVIAFQNPGGSELEGMIPLQDMLNKSDIDLIAASDQNGFRILYISGLDAQIDPNTGEEKVIYLSPGHLVRLSNPAARIGAVEGAGIESEITASSYWTQAIAGITRTPQYLFQPHGAVPPSGESLKMQETGLIAKSIRKQGVFGDSWVDVLTLSAKLYNIYGTGRVDIDRLEAEWHEVTRRDETEMLDKALKKLSLGIPKWQIWAELGYDDELIAKFEKSAADLTQQMLDTARKNFDRNVTPGARPE